MRRRPFSNTRRENATAALALVALSSASGCSFLFTDGPPARHRELASFQCGDSHVPPVLDTIGAGASVLIAVATANAKDRTIADADPLDQPQVRRDTNVAIGVFTAVAVLDAASALYGYRAVGACVSAEETRRAELARARLLPPPYGRPPYGEPPPSWPPPLAVAPVVTPSPAPSPSQ